MVQNVLGYKRYKKTVVGTLCPDEQYGIKTEAECKQAAIWTDYAWRGNVSEANVSSHCFFTEDERAAVFYNLSPNPDPTKLNSNYSEICSVPEGKTQSSYYRNNIFIYNL